MIDTSLAFSSRIPLNTGGGIPVLGFGTWQLSGAQAFDAVAHALRTGYRLIDTAMIYGNEREVGRAIRESGVARQEIFVTTKLWNSDHGYDRALKAFDASLERLGLDYVDLYLIHWPVPQGRRESWRALEELNANGRARAIGVSNYMVQHLDELLGYATIVPAVNQIELSPFLQKREVVAKCRAQGIVVEAYSPLTRGERLTEPRLMKIAFAHSKSAAQVLLRWGLQRGLVEIPKSGNPTRIEENCDLFDFELTDEELKVLDRFEENLHTSWDPTGEP